MMTHGIRPRTLLAWLMVAAAGFGCDDEPTDDTTCTPAMTQSCECPDGRAGMQVCAVAGTGFGACICASDSGALDGSASDDARTADASADGSVDGSALDRGAGSDGSSDLSDATADAMVDAMADATGPDPGRCALITASVTAAGFGDRVAVDCDDTHAWIRTDDLPPHDLMNGITTTNEQIPVPASWAAPVRLAPALAAGLTTIDSALGVAVNGVAIFDYSSQGEIDPAVYNPAVDTTLDGQLDVCNGHAGRGDDYHYHAAPVCMIEAMQNDGPDAILGWGFDGFPLFGFTRPDGAPLAAGDLDLCNGMADDTHGYRYHLSAAPPYVWQCLRGEVDLAIVPRIAPMVSRAGGQPRPQGRPPRGGVDDLRFVRDAEGGAEMTYRYEGADHFVRYRPSAQAGCYVFDIDTVSNGVVQGEYCRDDP